MSSPDTQSVQSTDVPRLGRVARLLIEAMGKHLPPSAASLRLLDVGGAAGAVLVEKRADLDIQRVSADPDSWTIAPDSFDAVVAYDRLLDTPLLRAALTALRPGGRLIVMDSRGEVSEIPVKTLESAGYTRILVEIGAECPLPTGVLMRGEKPHTTTDTLERIQQVAEHDHNALTLDDFRGKYVHLLVIQTPNKPVWAMGADDRYRWQAVTVDGALLAFSSLPKAVGFMQPAVVAGQITGVNKVAKFSRATAQTWPQPVLLNPTLDVLNDRALVYLDIDSATAEESDE